MEAGHDDTFPAVCPWASHFTSLSLCFLIHKMGIIGLLRKVRELKQKSTWLAHHKFSRNCK